MDQLHGAHDVPVYVYTPLRAEHDEIRSVANDCSPKDPWEDLDSSPHILKMLQDFSRYQCSDPRDRIYSMYNMATDMKYSDVARHEYNPAWEYEGPLLEFQVDYELDVRETYQSFALACAKAGKVAQLLQAVIDRKNNAEQTDWPSWVPNWRSEPVPLGNWSLYGSPLRYITHDSCGILLQSSGGCIANVSKDPARGNLLYIDYIGTPITATDNVDSLTLEIESFYHILSDAFPFFRDRGLGLFIDTLVCLLGLDLKAIKESEGRLSKSMPISDKAQETDTQEEACNLRDILVDAMKGKRWFRARIPDDDIFLCGITDTAIELGDELLVAIDLLHEFLGQALITGIIVRRTSTVQRATDAASSACSYRIIGRASLSWMIVEDTPLNDESYELDKTFSPSGAGKS